MPLYVARNILILAITMNMASCALFRNTTYNLITPLQDEDPQTFGFIIGTDLIKDRGGDENKVVNSLLTEELAKRHYCTAGYIITFHGEYQGGGYVLYKGRCKNQ